MNLLFNSKNREMHFFILLFSEIVGKDCMEKGTPLRLGEYTGNIGTTETGRFCQKWDMNNPHRPNYRPADARKRHRRRFLEPAELVNTRGFIRAF